MNATITISTDEIKQAIKEYVQRQGWVLSGQVTLAHQTDNDPRDGYGTTYSASMQVRPGRGE